MQPYNNTITVYQMKLFNGHTNAFRLSVLGKDADYIPSLGAAKQWVDNDLLYV